MTMLYAVWIFQQGLTSFKKPFYVHACDGGTACDDVQANLGLNGKDEHLYEFRARKASLPRKYKAKEYRR